jgi:hypothetical protein
MSADQHDEEAAKEEREAASHAKRFNPSARVIPRDDCMVPPPNGLAFPCWSSTMNPTAWHMREAVLHAHHAAEHRAASEELREAEGRACEGDHR